MNYKFIISSLYMIISLVLSSSVNAKHWTLQSSLTQAISASPELKQSAAEIGARSADLQLSDMWPDPSISLKLDNQVGLDMGSGDYALSEISISQGIPIARIKYQKTTAQAQLNSAMHAKKNTTLLLQNQVEKVFYELQHANAIYDLSVQRVKFANKYNEPENKKQLNNMVRYLSPLEKMRFSIISEKANQAEAAAEGKLREIRTQFYKLLVLDEEDNITVPELLPVAKVPRLNELGERQLDHPQLSTQKLTLQAAMSEIDVARNSVMKDPSISFSRLRENFSTGVENVYGLMVKVEIPIHDRKSSVVSKASYNASQQRIELGRLKLNLKMNLKRSFMHLNHVMDQALRYKEKVLIPAAKILKLSKQGFNSGELNILSLIDANNTYFESHMQYLDLIYQSRLELADVHLYTGYFILDENSKLRNNTVEEI